MALPLIPMTELEAVNAMLEMLNSAPVNSLPNSGVSEAYLARTILHRVSREIQGRGLSFNTDRKYKLTPNTSGFIVIPSNTLRVDASYPTEHYVPRYDVNDNTMKLYDVLNQTFVFTAPVYVDIVWFFNWEGLPDHVRYYVYVKAAREFQTKYQGNTAIFSMTEEDEVRARSEFLSTEYQQDDDTIFSSDTVFSIIRRRV